MAEVLVEFSESITDADGITYIAQACGAEVDGGMWHGWVEFIPIAGGETVSTDRETTQPNRIDTLYWATGLGHVYLEGALHRALTPLVPHPPRAASIFDPFSAYRHGEHLLRRQLGALSPHHLVNIVAAHELSVESAAELHRLTTPQLIELIVTGVRRATKIAATESPVPETVLPRVPQPTWPKAPAASRESAGGAGRMAAETAHPR